MTEFICTQIPEEIGKEILAESFVFIILTHKVFNFGHSEQRFEGTSWMDALSMVKVSRLLVSFKFGKVVKFLASDKALRNKASH